MATTEDGGFTAETEVVVDDFDAAVRVEGAWIDQNNKIRLALWNTSDYTVRSISFTVQCFDTQGYPMVCNKDGTSTSFAGSYSWELQPGDRTEHGQFNFNQYRENGYLGYIIVTVTGYEFDNGQKWAIPEDAQVPYQSLFSSHMWEPTQQSQQIDPDYDPDEDDDIDIGR